MIIKIGGTVMSLIKCPECGRQISDQSESCIHCGFPIKQKDNKYCLVNGKSYDLDFVLKVALNSNTTDQERKECFLQIQNMTRLLRPEKLYCKIMCDKTIPEIYNDDDLIPSPTPTQSSQPHCPYCNSTNLTKVSGTSRFASTLMFGIGSKKIGKQWKCNNCKSYF